MRIRQCNWRTRFGEIDIVAEDSGALVFVEVRLRSAGDRGSAVESVGPRKQRQLRLLADQYLQTTGHGGACRIDVIAIDLGPAGPRISHLRNAVMDS